MRPRTPRARGASPLTYSSRVPRHCPAPVKLSRPRSWARWRHAGLSRGSSAPCRVPWLGGASWVCSPPATRPGTAGLPQPRRRLTRPGECVRPRPGPGGSARRPRRPNAAAWRSVLWSGCGRSHKNVSSYCLFLPGCSPPLPANKAFPIAEHTATASRPSSRSPGPRSILAALPRPVPPPLAFTGRFPTRFPGFQGKAMPVVGGRPPWLLPRAFKAKPSPGWGDVHHSFFLELPRQSQARDGGTSTMAPSPSFQGKAKPVVGRCPPWLLPQAFKAKPSPWWGDVHHGSLPELPRQSQARDGGTSTMAPSPRVCSLLAKRRWLL